MRRAPGRMKPKSCPSEIHVSFIPTNTICDVAARERSFGRDVAGVHDHWSGLDQAFNFSGWHYAVFRRAKITAIHREYQACEREEGMLRFTKAT